MEELATWTVVADQVLTFQLSAAALAVAKRTSGELGQGSLWTRWNKAASQPLFAVLLPQIDGSANAAPTRKTITAR